MKAEYIPPVLSVEFGDEENWRREYIMQGMRSLALGSTFRRLDEGFTMEPNMQFFYQVERIVERVHNLALDNPKLVTVKANAHFL